MYIRYAGLYLCSLFDAGVDFYEAAKMHNTFAQVRMKITRSSEASIFIMWYEWRRGNLISTARTRIARLWRNTIILDTKLDFIAPIA